MNTKTLRKIAKVFIAIFILIALYVGLLNYQLYTANKKAASYCDLAVVGESFEIYKEKVRDEIDKSVEFDDKKWAHTFRGIAPLAFGVALCTVRTDGSKIISKEFLPTAGG